MNNEQRELTAEMIEKLEKKNELLGRKCSSLETRLQNLENMLTKLTRRMLGRDTVEFKE